MKLVLCGHLPYKCQIIREKVPFAYLIKVNNKKKIKQANLTRIP